MEAILTSKKPITWDVPEEKTESKVRADWLRAKHHKRKQSDATLVFEKPLEDTHKRRRNLFIALGIIAVLAIGFAAGMGTSILVNKSVQAESHDDSTQANIASPKISTQDSDDVEFDFDQPLLETADIVADIVAVRPNKFFGPKPTKSVSVGKDSLESLDEEDDVEEYHHVEKRGVWQPSPGLNWTYQLNMVPTKAQIKTASKYQVWDIDLYDTPNTTIKAIKDAGSKVICYFSAGTAEDWRTDFGSFTDADKGNLMGDWPGETWLNTNSANVRAIMAKRLDLAQAKGCNGVDPDNMDPYNHDTGFGLKQSDAVKYVTYLSQQAAKRGLAIGLKNAGDIIPSVVSKVQYSVEEACGAYNECEIYKPFTTAGKPVFHVEYPKGYGVVNTDQQSQTVMAPICSCIAKWKFSPIVKNNNLDSWQQQCS